jgi:hypothetical protein
MGTTLCFLPKREVVKIAGEDGHSLPKSFIICVATGDSPCHNYLILTVLLMVQIVDFVTVIHIISEYWKSSWTRACSMSQLTVIPSTVVPTFPSSFADSIKCHA